MASASSYFDLYCSAYSDDDRKLQLITAARATLSAAYYGSNYELAVGLLATHEMFLIGNNSIRANGEAGQISSKDEGDLSLTFGTSMSIIKNEPYLSQTFAGLKLLSLKIARLSMGVTGGAMANLTR